MLKWSYAFSPFRSTENNSGPIIQSKSAIVYGRKPSHHRVLFAKMAELLAINWRKRSCVSDVSLLLPSGFRALVKLRSRLSNATERRLHKVQSGVFQSIDESFRGSQIIAFYKV